MFTSRYIQRLSALLYVVGVSGAKSENLSHPAAICKLDNSPIKVD